MKKNTSSKKRTSSSLLCALLTGALLSAGTTTTFTSCDAGNSSNDSSLGTGQGLVDADFLDTVARFLEEGEARGITLDVSGLDIQYGDTDGALGVCARSSDLRAITISTRLRTASTDLLDEILLHELGHCALFRDHSTNPDSIMHATNIIGDPWRESVLDELFTF